MENIHFEPERNLWIIKTDNTAYSLGLSQNGAIYCTYYGSILPLASDYPLADDYPDQSSFTSREGLSSEEYMSWCKPKYTEPCLKATFFDHVRDVVLSYDSFALEGETLSIVLKDTYYPFVVYLRYKVIADCDIIEKTVEIRNTGIDPIILEQVLSGTLYPVRGDNYRLTYLTGRWGGETRLKRTFLPETKLVMESRRGTTGNFANPVFMLDEKGMADEDHGKVYAGALAYSGNWKIAIENDCNHFVKVTAGINDFDFAWELEPGTAFETPAFIIGYTENGFGTASRMFHNYQLRYVLPEENRHKLRKVLYNSWEARGFDVNEEEQCRLADVAASIGVELFVMDDGWFGNRNNDRAGLGDWYVNKKKFPNGLKGLIDHVNALGMDFGIWVEPEMVNPDSDLYRKHPDWVYYFEHRDATEMRNQLVLNLAREDVREFILQFMDKLLSENNIKFIKWDMNRNFSEPGFPSEKVEKQREVWVKHARGVYDIVKKLKLKHPDVIFQSCSGGGGRIDMGILRYFDQVWVSDNTDACDRLRIQEGFSYAYCAKIMESWVTGEVAGITGRRLSLEFRFHCAMMGNLGIGEDLFKWNSEEKTQAAKLIAEYKSIRHIVQHGQQYRLIGAGDNYICAVNYVSQNRKEAVLFAFLQNSHFGDQHLNILLKGFEDNMIYDVEGYSRMSGKALMCVGIKPKFKGDFSSVLVKIRQVD
jgi:alpha-galactosidase